MPTHKDQYSRLYFEDIMIVNDLPTTPDELSWKLCKTTLTEKVYKLNLAWKKITQTVKQ
jgi:hypothetical protein